MDFRLLGPLEVLRAGVPVQIAAGKQRALLAILLLNANHTVSREQLIDALWGETVPDSAQKMVQIPVSRRRKRLPERRGGRRTRSLPFRALGRWRPAGAFSEQLREGEGAAGRRACALARPGPRRVRRTLRQARARASRGASPGRNRIANRGGARAWASARGRRRARDAYCAA